MSKEMRKLIDDFKTINNKKLNVSEDNLKKGSSLTDKITDKYKIGDKIIFQHSKWYYESNKNIRTKEKGLIDNMYDYDDKNWGTLNIRIIPDRKDIRDNEGGLWITQHDILHKA